MTKIETKPLLIDYVQLDQVRKTITEEAQLEQMAEECCELGQALLKKARKLRNENYTPKSMDEINNDISEEFTDVMLCANALNLKVDETTYTMKLTRWVKRNLATRKE